MKINVTQVLKTFMNEPLTEIQRYDNPKFVDTVKTPDEPPQHLRQCKITLRHVCVEALNCFLASDKAVKAEEKVKLFTLAIKIQEHNGVDLSAEDVVLLKKRIGEQCRPLVVGRAFELLDPVGEK